MCIRDRLRIAQVATTRFKSGFATPHASGQLLQLHTFQVRTCNSTRLRPPCSSTCLMSAFATPHVSGQLVQLHSFQINHCNSTCFRSALATPHIWDQPLQLHAFQVCPCSWDSMFSPFSIWLLSRKHKVKSFQAFCGHTKALEAFSQWLFGRIDHSFGVIWHAFTNLYLKRASRSSLKQVYKYWLLQGTYGHFWGRELLHFLTFAIGLMKYEEFHLGLRLGLSFFDAFSKVEIIQKRQEL